MSLKKHPESSFSFGSQTHVIMEITFKSGTKQNQKYFKGSYHETKVSLILIILKQTGEKNEI